jgi:hypothetical protein
MLHSRLFAGQNGSHGKLLSGFQCGKGIFMDTRQEELFELEDIVRMLRSEVKRAGSQAEWARRNSVNQPDLSCTITGKRPPTKDILRALNLRKVFAYEPLAGQGLRRTSRARPKPARPRPSRLRFKAGEMR